MRAEQKVVCHIRYVNPFQELEKLTLPAPAGPITRTPNLLMLMEGCWSRDFGASAFVIKISRKAAGIRKAEVS